MNDHKEKLKQYLEIHDELKDLAEEWINEFGWLGRDAYNTSIVVDNESYPPTIEATYISDISGCHDEREHDITIPLSVLWDDQAFERERKSRLEANLAAVRKKQEEDAKTERLDKARRYEEYLDLCKEFDDNS